MRSCGVLLCGAVNGAKSPNKVATKDADHIAARKKFAENVQRDPIVGVVERRNKDALVRDVKVGITRGQSLTSEPNG
jgi:hypothetical protein